MHHQNGKCLRVMPHRGLARNARRNNVVSIIQLLPVPHSSLQSVLRWTTFVASLPKPSLAETTLWISHVKAMGRAPGTVEDWVQCWCMLEAPHARGT